MNVKSIVAPEVLVIMLFVAVTGYFIMSKIKIILIFISKIFKIPIKFINNILNKLKKLIKFKEKKGEFGK